MPTASGSFHAGNLIPNVSPYHVIDSSTSQQRRHLRALRRQSTMKHYTTFPTQPPKTPSERPSPALEAPEDYASDVSSSHSSDSDENDEVTPLPYRQLALLALLSLAEQTALNSISPYLPTMVASFEEIPKGQVGLYVGLLASAFALAQLTTNLMWGYVSDIVGRKPVMLVGTSLLTLCFVFFGFCTHYWQLVIVQVAMGLLNGNAAVVPTCLGEVTDRTNQSRAFTWLPVMYSIGGISGPALGGLLVRDGADYPFLAPNFASAILLAIAVVVLAIWFEETLDDAEKKAAGAGLQWVGRLCSCGRSRKRPNGLGSWSSRWPHRGSQQENIDSATSSVNGDEPNETDALLPSRLDREEKSVILQLLNRNTIIVLLSYLVFQLANISFNSLYPIFASAPAPTGRELNPETIGLLLSLAGLAVIVFQAFLFQPLKSRLGNLGTYRIALFGIAVTMVIMPWVGYKTDPPLVKGWGTGKAWLYAELAAVLVVKNICSIGGLSSVLLLVCPRPPLLLVRVTDI